MSAPWKIRVSSATFSYDPQNSRDAPLDARSFSVASFSAFWTRLTTVKREGFSRSNALQMGVPMASNDDAALKRVSVLIERIPGGGATYTWGTLMIGRFKNTGVVSENKMQLARAAS
jgi:hypothetical protein